MPLGWPARSPSLLLSPCLSRVYLACNGERCPLVALWVSSVTFVLLLVAQPRGRRFESPPLVTMRELSCHRCPRPSWVARRVAHLTAHRTLYIPLCTSQLINLVCVVTFWVACLVARWCPGRLVGCLWPPIAHIAVRFISCGVALGVAQFLVPADPSLRG